MNLFRWVGKYRLLFLAALVGIGSGSIACTPQAPTKSLPASSSLGGPRGFSVLRVITHFHSVYSWDACDNNGLPDGQVNATCNAHLLDALCKNRVDYVFITDHPAKMQDYEFRDLLITDSTDQVVNNSSGNPYAKVVGSCSNGHRPVYLIGFEDKIMAFGMTQHLETTPSARGTTYGQDTNAVRLRLSREADAIVAVPHTESRTLTEIQTLNPDAIEIFNFHATTDPKIRRANLNTKPFSKMSAFLSYILDPYRELVPDLGFLHFVEIFPTYTTMWNNLVYSGYQVTGVIGSDSHENVLPQIVADDERLDSHRRVVRMASNHFLVNSNSISDVKDAIKKGRGWMVFEGLGTPVGMDFTVTVNGNTVGVGESVTLGGKSAVISVNLPTLHPDTPQGSDRPHFVVNLKRVLAAGGETIVATSVDTGLSYTTSGTGIFRAEIEIIPLHLKPYLSSAFSKLAENRYPWIITNHLYLNP
ncbi:MAG: hypothetical protein HYX67_16980 [Candidatus Melainabacteria bacterium]|nr:hypothetical protein [Candidatus Melainabacteria bacterium]